MSVVLRCDHREKNAKELLRHEDIKWELLELGDFVIDIDGVPRVVIERKTLPDLAASVKDGRYKNQKIRLLEQFSISCLFYVIEGNVTYNDCNGVLINGISYGALQGCIINTMIRDGIKIFFTNDSTETCELVCKIYERMKKDPSKYCNSSSGISVSTGKRKIASKHECYIAQLCQIPGISNITACAIAQKYPTMLQLITNSSKLGFDDVKIGKKSLSKSLIQRLHEFLYD